MWRRPLRETPGDGRRCRPSCARDLASSSEQLLAADLLTPPEKLCNAVMSTLTLYVHIYVCMYDMLYVVCVGNVYIFFNIITSILVTLSTRSSTF